MWGPDIPAVPPETAIRHFGLAAMGFVGLALLCKYAITPDPPVVPREYPFDGLCKELGGLDVNKVGVPNPCSRKLMLMLAGTA
jgi:NADH dehydrogenase (ubiquinone) 1 beta subcomplex subunit 8